MGFARYQLVNFYISIISINSFINAAGNVLCQTESCQQTAKSILRNMDKSVNPCTNFYKFVCGNFIKNAEIPGNKALTGSHPYDNFNTKLKSSMEKIGYNSPEPFKKLRKFYDTCMNRAQINQNSHIELRELLVSLGDWPVLAGRSWNESVFNWDWTSLWFRDAGLFFEQFIRVAVEPHLLDSSKNLIYLYPPKPIIDEKYLMKGKRNKIVQAHLAFMIDMAVSFGADQKFAEKELGDVIDFEIDLTRLIKSADQTPGQLSDFFMTIQTLSTKIPEIRWLAYLDRIMGPRVILYESDKVILTQVNYFKKLADFLSRRPKRVLANYAFWRAVYESRLVLGNVIARAQLKYFNRLYGVSASPNWFFCLQQTNDRFPLAMGSLFVWNHFSKGEKDSAMDMVKKIRESYRQILLQNDWMTSKTRTSALAKLDKMAMLVGYPDELLNSRKLDNYYKDFHVNTSSMFKTDLSHKLFEATKKFEKLRQPVNKTDWTGLYGSVVVSNAYYEFSNNALQLPGGYLKRGFNYPNYLLYGGVGTVMGHEMTHGFDDVGRLFDKDGTEDYWWDVKTEREFDKRKRCFIDQYNSYRANEFGNNELKVDGKKSLNENISDNGGLKEAYYAYEAWAKKNGEEARLPGLAAYSPRQMFWIGHAEFWCTRFRPEAYVDIVTTDTHPPPEFRVNGATSNRPEFARDFNCPPRSPMNPEKKCVIW